MFPSYHLSSTPDINIPIPEAIPGPDPFLEIRIAHAPAPQEDKLQVTIIDHRDQTISVLLTSDISTTHSAVNSINALGSPFRPADPRTNYRHYMQQFYARRSADTDIGSDTLLDRHHTSPNATTGRDEYSTPPTDKDAKEF